HPVWLGGLAASAPAELQPAVRPGVCRICARTLGSTVQIPRHHTSQKSIWRVFSEEIAVIPIRHSRCVPMSMVTTMLGLARNSKFIPLVYTCCDMWCERCPVTSQCLLFASEQLHAPVSGGDRMRSRLNRSLELTR